MRSLPPLPAGISCFASTAKFPLPIHSAQRSLEHYRDSAPSFLVVVCFLTVKGGEQMAICLALLVSSGPWAAKNK